MTLPDIKDLTLPELEDSLTRAGEPRYRAEQVFLWLYRQREDNFSRMLNIPPALREKLSQKFEARGPRLISRETSPDGAAKFLLGLRRGELIETVFIPSEKRNTVCVSTQAGCRRRCRFCASGENGLKRNLSPGEITAQFLDVERITGKKLTSLVFMGMGEPFDNYDNLLSSIRILNHPLGINLSARKMTVSTAGIIEGIRKFSEFELPVNLAVSLHAPEQGLRKKLMPLAGRHKLPELLEALDELVKTGRKLTIEYALMENINDSVLMARKLARIAGRLGCTVNIIAFNPVPGKPFSPPPRETVQNFMDELHSRGVMVSLRRSRGREISAACGQLSGREP